ncbi:hypothetical protein IF1G_09111 [Cordyceps javanica]|uniref:Uncharacterized protein n=1 Tax=Cordyceps javanica TaxID=43265 RepID=A0A545VR86_9HYPO|nr:hypothetical protein IF1G_09111 [Cordyceps javanica]TQW04175.1 hypothetical protein IF2G_08489 [Cordyceps javanica]
MGKNHSKSASSLRIVGKRTGAAPPPAPPSSNAAPKSASPASPNSLSHDLLTKCLVTSAYGTSFPLIHLPAPPCDDRAPQVPNLGSLGLSNLGCLAAPDECASCLTLDSLALHTGSSHTT